MQLLGLRKCFCRAVFSFRRLTILVVRIADMLGRRWAMVVECLIFIIGVVVQLAAERVWAQLAVGRLISGLGVGALSAAVPMVCFSYNS